MDRSELKHGIERWIMQRMPREMPIRDLVEQSIQRIVTRDLLKVSDDLVPTDLTEVMVTHAKLFPERNALQHMSPDEAFDHAIEWLIWSVREKAEWLDNKDENGRIRKLAKLGGMVALMAEADAQIAKQEWILPQAESSEDAEPVMDLANGFYVVRLRTPDALKRESAMMGHCVGLGGYDHAVKDGSSLIYSIRDRRHRSHATLHVRAKDRTVVELRGKQNQMPVRHYREVMLPFLDKESFHFTNRASWRGGHGILALDDGTHCLPENIPENAVFKDLSLPGEQFIPAAPPRWTGTLKITGNLPQLQEDYRFRGSVDLSDAHSGGLPKGLVVEGDMRIAPHRGNLTTPLPIGLTVMGTLELSPGHQTSLPQGVTFSKLRMDVARLKLSPGQRIPGSLEHVGPCADWVDIPEGIHVEGDLILAGLGLRKLPNRLVVEGDLDVSQTQVSTFPLDISIGGSIRASQSCISHLGGLHDVNRDLDLSLTPIAALPARLRVGGDLDLSGTLVENLPRRLVVGGDLDLSRSCVRRARGRVGGLIKRTTPSRELPRVEPWTPYAGESIDQKVRMAWNRLPPPVQRNWCDSLIDAINGWLWRPTKSRDRAGSHRSS